MQNTPITNEMLYELLKELKTDVDRRFNESQAQLTEFKAETNRRFGEVNHTLASLEERNRSDKADLVTRLKDIQYDLRLDKDKLEKVYEARERITVNFTRAFAFGNASFAAVLAVIVSFFVSAHR